MLTAIKAASEKLSALHSATLSKITELVKELVKYSEELHKKQKQIKDEEAPTSDVVKALQETTVLLHKSKDFYKAKSVELEKLKRESPSPKELEKGETKFRKAQEEYKNLCDKFSSQREEFEKKMLSSCKHFQQAETLYLTQMVDFVHSFHDLIDRDHNSVGKVNLELEEQLVQNTVEKMLEQFVLLKYTGLVKPGNRAVKPARH
jgi:DNA repair ATPase RecN